MIKAAIREASIPFAEAALIFRQEGLIPLLRRASAFLVSPFFSYETHYLFEYAVENIDNVNEADFMPRTDGFAFKTVSTKEEADELEAGGVDFRCWSFNCREKLDSGAVIFCVLVGEELAHMRWVALTQSAKDCMRQPPFRVDFSSGEYCVGVWTNPKHRRKRFAQYAFLKATQFLRDRGKTRSRSAVLKGNVASLAAVALFGAKRYAEARYLKLFWWEFWKEKPLDSMGAGSSDKVGEVATNIPS